MIEAIGFSFEVKDYRTGEHGVKVTFSEDTDCDRVGIHWLFEHDSEFMVVAQLVSACRSLLPDLEIGLMLPYVPYCRQDRRETFLNSATNEVGATPNSLKDFSRLVNSLGFSRVVVFDPHSYAIEACLDNCFVLDASPDVQDYDCLIAPDAGANKKVEKLGKQHNKTVATCLKAREDGKVTNLEFFGDYKDCYSFLVVDDICDGGTTFIKVAEAFEEKKRSGEIQNDATISLYVTHGFFTVEENTRELLRLYDKISCKFLYTRNQVVIENIKFETGV